MAIVDLAGVRKECCLAYVPEAAIGDYVIVQNGFAITTLDQMDALASMAAFADLGLLGTLDGPLNLRSD